jgi:hypothetical protein
MGLSITTHSAEDGSATADTFTLLAIWAAPRNSVHDASCPKLD